MGWRVTSQNLNLNRDYVKADAPEMQAMLRLLNEWDPIVYVDLHVTDGAKFEHDVVVNVGADAGRRRGAAPGRGRRCATALMQRAAAQGSLPLDVLSVVRRATTIPASGFAVDGVARRASRRTTGPRGNRIGILVETHSWKDYPTRVRVTHNAIVGLLELAAAQRRRVAGGGPRRRRHGGARSAARAVALRYQATDTSRHARVPRLRLHARAVADLGRHRDALRRDDAADLARAAPRRGEADGDVDGAARAATSCPPATRRWVARETARCTASSAGRSRRR